jgi:DnaK suppressor protein
MAAIAQKKTGKKKAVKSPAKKVSVKPSGKTNKTVTAKKKENKILTAKKSAAAKPVAKKPVAKKAVTKSPAPAKPLTKRPVAKKTAAKKPLAKKTVKEGKPQEKTGNSKDRLLALKKALISKKETILKEVKEEISKYVSGDNKQLVDTANDEGDWAQVDISEDLSLQRLSAHRKLMYNIDEAIRKIEEGTYGICEDCGEEISEKRLLVLPAATLCVDCQENREQVEALEGKE